MDRAAGLVVIVLTIYSDDSSLNPAEDCTLYSVKLLVKDKIEAQSVCAIKVDIFDHNRKKNK